MIKNFEVYGGLADSNNANMGRSKYFNSGVVIAMVYPGFESEAMYGLVNKFSFIDRLPIDYSMFGVYRLLRLLK